MSTTAPSDPPGTDVLRNTVALEVPIIVEPEVDVDAEERGRLKRRRLSSHSPRRASSPSRGHDRCSGSRFRQHHRKHHRPSSPASSVSPSSLLQKKARRRSDAEPDHTFRGRARNRSGSRGKNRSPIIEDDDIGVESDEDFKRFRKRSAPPSRHRVDGAEEGEDIRRQRSYPNLYMEDRRHLEDDAARKEVLKHESAHVGRDASIAQNACRRKASGMGDVLVVHALL